MVDGSIRWGKEKEYIWFQGPWEPFVRNIDPTSIYHRNDRNPFPDQKAWRNKVNYRDWEGDHENWLVSEENLPEPKAIIDVADTKNAKWLALESHLDWEEPVPIGHETYEYPHKHLWYQIRSYFVSKEHADRLISWAKEQHFMGGWLPEGNQQYQVFTREYYWSPAYRFFDNPYYGRSNWEKVHEKSDYDQVLGEVMPTTEGHLWESGGDYENQPSYLAPREYMYSRMRLQPSKNIGEWLNAQGEIACFDPSVKQGSPSCLLVRKNSLLQFLEENNLRIFWTCLGEKQIYGDSSHKIQVSRWLELSGVFTLVEDEVVGSINPLVQGVIK
jgi:hypothetical protein